MIQQTTNRTARIETREKLPHDEWEERERESDSLSSPDYQARELMACSFSLSDGEAEELVNEASTANLHSFGMTGVDTLKLFYPVRPLRRPDFHLVRQQEMKREGVMNRFLWRDPNGHPAWGAMAVRRVGAMRFRIATVGTEVKLRAFFSVPRVVHGHNGRAVDQGQLQTALETMQAVLSELGLQIDWREGQLSRLDVHRDVLLRRPFHYYLAALRLLEPRYGRLFGNYPSGVVRGTATRMAYSLYDKRAERQHRGYADEDETPLETSGEAQFRPGWLRLEARLPTASAVRDGLGFETAGDLVGNFEKLPLWLDRKLESDLFAGPIPPHPTFPLSPSPTYSPHDESWWYSQLMGWPDGFKDRLALIGLRMAYETLGQERFWQLARECGYDDTLSVSKLRKHFRVTAMNSFSDELVPIGQLFEELKCALLTPPNSHC